jgi:hypothetical protein
MKPAALVATGFLFVVAAAHLLRLLFGVEVIAGGRVVPMWVSAVAPLVTGGLGFALWRESRRPG